MADADANRAGAALFALLLLSVVCAIVFHPWSFGWEYALRYAGINLAVAMTPVLWLTWISAKRDSAANARLVGAQEDIASRDDSTVGPAWLIARGTLEKYWRRNLSQNYLVFALSVLAMAAGFVVMLWGITGGFAERHESVAWAGAVGGAITQFIGATFLLIYRSTLDQASAYNNTLERINAVGMAWSILETMPESTAEEAAVKNAAKTQIISRIVGSPSGVKTDASS